MFALEPVGPRTCLVHEYQNERMINDILTEHVCEVRWGHDKPPPSKVDLLAKNNLLVPRIEYKPHTTTNNPLPPNILLVQTEPRGVPDQNRAKQISAKRMCAFLFWRRSASIDVCFDKKRTVWMKTGKWLSATGRRNVSKPSL